VKNCTYRSINPRKASGEKGDSLNSLLTLLNQKKFSAFAQRASTAEFKGLPKRNQLLLQCLYLIRSKDVACLTYIPKNFQALEERDKFQVLLEFADYLSRTVTYSSAAPIFAQLVGQHPTSSDVWDTYIRHLIRHEHFESALREVKSGRAQLDQKQINVYTVAALDGMGHTLEALQYALESQGQNAETVAILIGHIGRYEEAAQLFEALGDEISDKAAYEFALVLLKLREYEKAWRYYQARPIYSPHSDSITRMSWRSDAPGVTLDPFPVFVWEQGLGDQLLFLRYAGWYRSLTGQRLRVYIEDRLRNLLEHPEYQGFDDIEFREDPPSQNADEKYYGLASLPFLLQQLGGQSAPKSGSPPQEYWDLNARSNWTLAGQHSGVVGVAWKSSAPKGAALKSVALESLLETIPPEQKLMNLNFEPETEAEILALGVADRFVQTKPPDRKNLLEVYKALQCCERYVGISNTYVHLGQLFGLPSEVHIPHTRSEIWYWAKCPSGSTSTGVWFSAASVICNCK
jgi:hypothetical protein